MTKETMTDIDIRISSLKGVPSAVLSQLDDLFDSEFGSLPVVFSDSDWFIMGFAGDLLVCRVGIVKRVVSVADEIVVVGGVGGVVTRPDYRKHGYASKLMRCARRFMRDELPADFGMLLCREELEPFYRHLGWRVVPGPTGYAQPGGSMAAKGLTMVIELGKSKWPEGPIDLCGFPW
ncbi:MAG: GNAT family N-acetyltransferase [bacterium]